MSLTQPGPDRVWKFICAMESKLPNTILRMGLAPDILAAKVVSKLWLRGDAWLVQWHLRAPALAVHGCWRGLLATDALRVMYARIHVHVHRRRSACNHACECGLCPQPSTRRGSPSPYVAVNCVCAATSRA